MNAGTLPSCLGLSPGDLQASGTPGFWKRLRGLLDAGLPALLLREPQLGARAFLEVARRCQEIMAPLGRPLLLHDAPHLVGPLGAGGAHLGFRSLPPEPARRLLPAEAWLGLSTHAGDAVPSREVDYCFFGPVFPTPSKAGWVEPVGLEGLRARVMESRNQGGPALYALGGVNEERAASVWQCGVQGIAVRGALWDARHSLAHLPRLFQNPQASR